MSSKGEVLSIAAAPTNLLDELSRTESARLADILLPLVAGTRPSRDDFVAWSRLEDESLGTA
jgi:hypothetical protein